MDEILKESVKDTAIESINDTNQVFIENKNILFKDIISSNNNTF